MNKLTNLKNWPLHWKNINLFDTLMKDLTVTLWKEEVTENDNIHLSLQTSLEIFLKIFNFSESIDGQHEFSWNKYKIRLHEKK